MSNVRVKFHEKKFGSGQVGEFFVVDGYDDDLVVEVVVDGKPQRSGWDVPHRITERERRAHPIPAAAVVGARCCLFAEPEATAVEEAFDRVVREITAARQTAADGLGPAGYLYQCGCDGPNTYQVLWPEGSSFESEKIAAARLKSHLIEKHLRGKDFDDVAKETDARPVPANLATYGGWEFSPQGFTVLLSIATSRAAHETEEAAKKRAARDEALAAKVALARETGKPVEIASWSEDCDDPSEECSQDIVTRFVHPDGSFTVQRRHTW